MSSDPGNMPFQRVMPGDAVSMDDEPVRRMAQPLHAESILLQEFNHANVTAYQAKEERTRVFNTYLVLLGIITSGLVTLETIYAIRPNVGLTVVAIIVGVFTVATSGAYYVRVFVLGSTLQDSTIAMNVIKEFYIQQLKRQMPQLEQAFHWRLLDGRDREQSGRMPFVMNCTLALSGSLSLAFAVYLFLFLREELALPQGSFVQTTLTDFILIGLAFGIGVMSFAVSYAALDLRHNPTRKLRAEADKLGLVMPGK